MKYETILGNPEFKYNQYISFILQDYIIKEILIQEDELAKLFTGHKNEIRIHYIYKISFSNGKSYVGQSVDPSARWKAHKNEAEYITNNIGYKTDMLVDGMLAKYGINNSIFEVLYKCHGQQATNDMETEAVKIHRSHVSENGYNISRGGWNSEKSPETRAKISATLMGRKIPRDIVERGASKRRGRKQPVGWISPRTGSKDSEELKKKKSEARVGMVYTEEHKANISKAKKGIKQSPETIKKRFEKLIGRKMSPEEVAKHTGWNMKEEAKAKISSAQSKKNSMAKLNWDKVKEIREAFKSIDSSNEETRVGFYDAQSDKYDVSRMTIKLLILNKTWSI